MREGLVNQVRDNAKSLEQKFDEFMDSLGQISDPQGRTFGASQTIAGTDASLSDLRARTAAIAGLVAKFDPNGAALLPFADGQGMLNSVSTIIQTLERNLNAINSAISQNGGISSIDQESQSINFNNGQRVGFSGQFKQLFDAIEVYLTNFKNVSLTIKPQKSSVNFSSATKSLSNVIQKTINQNEQLDRYINTSRSEFEKITSHSALMDNIIESSNEKSGKIDELLSRSESSVTKIAELDADISEIHDNTLKLKNRTENYESEFTEFQENLDALNSSIASGREKLESLLDEFRSQSSSFDDMISKSNQMLSSATAAGLASEFNNIRSDLGDKLDQAQTSFKWAIGFLSICALPLMLLILSPLFAIIYPNDQNVLKILSGLSIEQNSWHYIGQVIARFIILLPAIWYVAFCSARYNSLFKLREHYSYKYSMAVSVEGFKKQAPEYSNDIAALVFEQLSFNPADKLGKHFDAPEDPPHPIAKIFFNKLLGKHMEVN